MASGWKLVQEKTWRQRTEQMLTLRKGRNTPCNDSTSLTHSGESIRSKEAVSLTMHPNQLSKLSANILNDAKISKLVSFLVPRHANKSSNIPNNSRTSPQRVRCTAGLTWRCPPCPPYRVAGPPCGETADNFTGRLRPTTAGGQL